MKENHTTSRLLICAGSLMGFSGLLMCLTGRVAIGGILFASATCMFGAARSFRIAEEKQAQQDEDDSDEKDS